jgi:hypothetical protein
VRILSFLFLNIRTLFSNKGGILERQNSGFRFKPGADDIGFAKASADNSPKSFEWTNFLPSVKSLIVLIFKELSSRESSGMGR